MTMGTEYATPRIGWLDRIAMRILAKRGVDRRVYWKWSIQKRIEMALPSYKGIFAGTPFDKAWWDAWCAERERRGIIPRWEDLATWLSWTFQK
jgi:hypothetical protein